MMGRTTLPVALLIACFAISAEAATGASSKAPATARATASRSGTAGSARHPARVAKSAAARGSTGGRTSGVASGAPGSNSSDLDAAAEGTHAKGGTRALREIHIEGEIPVPQVLFITARDQRRIVDFNHRRYLKTSVEVGRCAILPTSIVVVPQP